MIFHYAHIFSTGSLYDVNNLLGTSARRDNFHYLVLLTQLYLAKIIRGNQVSFLRLLTFEKRTKSFGSCLDATVAQSHK